MSTHASGRRTRPWAEAKVRVLGPARETGSYRAALYGRWNHVAAEWWRCTGHPPHKDEDAARGCAKLARERLIRESRITTGGNES